MAEFERVEKLTTLNVAREVIERVPARLCKEYKIFPLEETEDTLRLAMADIYNLQAIDDVRFIVKKKVKPVVAPPEEIERMITKFHGVGAAAIESAPEEEKGPDLGGMLVTEVGATEDADSVDMAEDSAVVNFVRQMLQEAVRRRATDVHIEPLNKELRIRYRVDGMLQEVNLPPTVRRFKMAIISRVKIMSKMDIAERRLPQDGRFEFSSAGQGIDCRVSTIPTVHGESTAIRLLKKTTQSYKLPDTGMAEDHMEAMRKLIRLPTGIVLITGPTGSGKSTTLNALMQEINTPEKKIITVEDPVEYQLAGVDQIAVNEQIGLTFSVALRHILRQNPNVVMLGEMRDTETAETAIRASLTGHLVLSTLHTNDAPSAVMRLVDMGVEPYLVSSSVRGVLAQRLARTVCEHCKQMYEPTPEEVALWRMPLQNGEKPQLAKGKGCDWCGDGTLGRAGIHELFLMDETIEDLVLQKVPSSEIRKLAQKKGMRTLNEDAWMKAKKGLIPVEEVFRLTAATESNGAAAVAE